MQLIATVTQGAANAFIQGAINTGLSASLNNGYRLTQIEAEYPEGTPSAAGIMNYEYAVSRASKAAVPTLADDDVLWRDRRGGYYGAGTTVFVDDITSDVPTQEILLIEEVIYLQFKTLNLTAAQSLIVRLTVEPVKVTDSQRIAILQSRIN